MFLSNSIFRTQMMISLMTISETREISGKLFGKLRSWSGARRWRHFSCRIWRLRFRRRNRIRRTSTVGLRFMRCWRVSSSWPGLLSWRTSTRSSKCFLWYLSCRAISTMLLGSFQQRLSKTWAISFARKGQMEPICSRRLKSLYLMSQMVLRLSRHRMYQQDASSSSAKWRRRLCIHSLWRLSATSCLSSLTTGKLMSATLTLLEAWGLWLATRRILRSALTTWESCSAISPSHYSKISNGSKQNRPKSGGGLKRTTSTSMFSIRLVSSWSYWVSSSRAARDSSESRTPQAPSLRSSTSFGNLSPQSWKITGTSTDSLSKQPG